MKDKESWPLTLTLFSNTEGLWYVISNGPGKLLSYGVKTTHQSQLRKYLKKVKSFLEFCQPHIVLLQGQGHKTAKLSRRRIQIIEAIVRLTEKHKCQVFRYSRNDIHIAFSGLEVFGTKYQMARKIAEWFPVLKSKLPLDEKRKDHKSEYYWTGLFDAVSLMITHYFMND